MNWDKTYVAIDLKSFYASVECVERGLDPLSTNLVVADDSRTDKTICLAVTPSLKKYGLSGRSRLFEVKQKVTQIKNEIRRLNICANNVISHTEIQPSLFDKSDKEDTEEKLQQTILNIQKKYGRNALLKAYDFEEQVKNAT